MWHKNLLDDFTTKYLDAKFHSTGCQECLGLLAFLVSPSLSSLHLAAPSSTLPSYLPSYLSLGAGRAPSLLSSRGPSGVKPLFKKNVMSKISHSFEKSLAEWYRASNATTRAVDYIHGR